MTIFTEVFLIAIVISAFGGLINTVIRSVRRFDDGSLTFSRFIVWFLRDIFAGLGAGFGIWLLNQAMNNDAGIYLAAFVAGLAGVAALDQLVAAAGYKRDRDLLVQSTVDDQNVLEPLKERLQKSETQREILTQQVQELQAKLVVLAEAKLSGSLQQESDQDTTKKDGQDEHRTKRSRK